MTSNTCRNPHLPLSKLWTQRLPQQLPIRRVQRVPLQTQTRVNDGAKVQSEPLNQQDAITLESSDDEYDEQILKKFPIDAHLPVSNKPYDALKLKRSFLMEKSNKLETLRTRKPIRSLTNQEKQNLQGASLVFLKDRFKSPAHTIDPKTGRRLEQVAQKSGTK